MALLPTTLRAERRPRIRRTALGIALAGFLLAASPLGAAGAWAQRYGDSPVPVSVAPTVEEAHHIIASCLVAAAAVYRLPPAILIAMLRVEGGSLGRVSRNTNATVDIGPMQINQIWLPDLARRWKTMPDVAFTAIRDNFCANIEAASWILRAAIDRSNGDFWDGVGRYHSGTEHLKLRYLRRVFDQVSQLAAPAASAQPARPAQPAARPAPQAVTRAASAPQPAAAPPAPRSATGRQQQAQVTTR